MIPFRLHKALTEVWYLAAILESVSPLRMVWYCFSVEVCVDDREADDGTVSAADIVERVIQLGSKSEYLGDFDTIEKYILENCKNNDLLITLGSGPIYTIGESLLRQ